MWYQGILKKKEVRGWIEEYYGPIQNSEKTKNTESDYESGASYNLDNYKITGDSIQIQNHEKAANPIVAISYPTYDALHEDAPALDFFIYGFSKESSLWCFSKKPNK